MFNGANTQLLQALTIKADVLSFIFGILVFQFDAQSSTFKGNVSADGESFGQFTSSCVTAISVSALWVFCTRLYLWGALQWAKESMPGGGDRNNTADLESGGSDPKVYAEGFAPLFESMHGMCVGVSAFSFDTAIVFIVSVVYYENKAFSYRMILALIISAPRALLCFVVVLRYLLVFCAHLLFM